MNKTKHLFRPLMAIVMLLAMLVPQGALALSGNGSSSNPYQITDGKEFYEFYEKTKSQSDACAILVNDITMRGYALQIGCQSPYKGTFDGNGKTIHIEGYTFNSSWDWGGLFNRIEDATIKNLNVTGNINFQCGNAGSVVGYAMGNSQILNVTSSANMTYEETYAVKHIGGIVGNIEGSTVVKGCTYTGTMNVGKSTDSNGGIVGFANANCGGTIQYCFFNGTIKTTGSGPVIGGILGYVNDESSPAFGGVQNCYSCGTLAFAGSDTHVNAIVGRIRARATTTINNTYLSGIATRACNTDGPRIPESNKAITISVTAGSNGTVSQSYVNPTTEQATQLQVVATPNAHYHLNKWSDNGAQTHNVGLTDKVDLSASFAIDQHQITVKTNNSNYGTVTGGGTYDWNSKQTIKATAKSHYHFVEWNDGNTDATRTITVTGDKTYTATFAIDQHTITVNVANGQTDMGTVSGGGTFDYNSTKTITATPKSHYHFVKWNDGNTNASRTITVTEDKTYTATFAIDQHTITVKTNDSNMGTVSGGGKYDYNTQQTITATPKSHYHFVKWNDGNTNASRTITVTEDKTYTATFAIDQHTITVKTNNSNYGTVSGGGTFDYGSAETITATPKTGYHFVKWSDNNTDATRTITVTGDATYTATFEAHTYGDWITDTDPTCTAEGTKHRVCTHAGCNEREDGTIPATGHAMTGHAHVDATCATSGNEEYWTCSNVCCEGKYYKDENGSDVWGSLPTIATLGHQWGDDYTCTVCHAIASETIAHTGTSGTCTWSFYEDRHMIIEPTEGETGTLGEWWDPLDIPWIAYKRRIKSVKFQGEIIASTCYFMFNECTNLTTIDFSGFNTANVKYMSGMFTSCSSLQSLDLSGFNTANVGDMSYMFSNCSSLQSLDLSGFNTANVRDMSYMFNNCSSLQSIDLSGFNTANVENFSSMFSDCHSLATLKLSNDFVLKEGINKDFLFFLCSLHAGSLWIYYVIDQNIQEALSHGAYLEHTSHVFVQSAIVKDGVPFKMTYERGADIPAENVVFTRTFTAGKPASAMLPFTVAPSQISGATFYEFKGVKYENNEWVADMQDVSIVEAYKPYVVITTGAGITFHDGSVSFPQTPDASAMITTDDETGWTFVALNEFKRWEAGDEEIGKAYGFAGKDKDYDDYSVAKGEFVKVAAGASAKPGRCYLVKNDGEPLTRAAEELPATIKVRFISGSSNGIGTLNTETGEMTLEGWYDLNGNRIDEPSKGGIFIHNNKKVMVK